jgi:glyoxylase-like metal-dependent hydrolase (beta-lactamase superfamily II)
VEGFLRRFLRTGLGRTWQAALFILAVSMWTTPAVADELDDLVVAMGTDKVKTIEFTAGGFYYHPGGSALADEEWPKFKIVGARQRINFETKSLSFQFPLEQFLNPPRGAGFQPIKGLLSRNWQLKGDQGWSVGGGKARPLRSTAFALHWLWTSPHGIIKAAQESNAKVTTDTIDGKTWRKLAIEHAGAFRAIGWFDSDSNLLRKVEAQIAHEVLGDMSVVTLYTGYKVFDGVQHPARIIVSYAGHPALDLQLNTITPNADFDLIVPAGLKPYSVRTKAEKVTDGIWAIRGGSHHSYAIELQDSVIVYEAPLSTARGEAVIAAVRETIPKKKIKLVINSHHHFDHSGGLRAFAFEEIPIITHETNQNLYAEAFATARSIDPDKLANTGIKARFLTMGESYKILDADRIIELYTLKGNPHCESNIIAYLPREKILMVADAYSSRKTLQGPLDEEDVNPAQAHLWNFLQERGLKVETILPIHGPQVNIKQLKWAAGIGGKKAMPTRPEDIDKAADKAMPKADEKPAPEKPESKKPEAGDKAPDSAPDSAKEKPSPVEKP